MTSCVMSITAMRGHVSYVPNPERRGWPSQTQRETDMIKVTHDGRGLSIDELDGVSGGEPMLGFVIAAAENYMNGLFGRLMDAAHTPVTPKPTMSLGMRN